MFIPLKCALTSLKVLATLWFLVQSTLVTLHHVDEIGKGLFLIHNYTPEMSPDSSAAAAKSLQSCPTPCNPIDGSPPGSSIPGILQARIPEWVAISFSNACTHVKSPQSCPTLCDPMDSSPSGSSIHRILQASILEWA